MRKEEAREPEIEEAGKVLFDFAVDREDVKTLISWLPGEARIERDRVEYELQVLKIISVGWSVSYFLENSRWNTLLSESYWKAVFEFSRTLSSAAGLMVGQDIDYFQVLRDRLDTYVEALNSRPDAPEPGVVIGPEFARACGNVDDVYTIMTGSRMFINTVGSVREYLDALRLA
ncbi:MAG: hypothetical protein HPY84_10115 [Syntrophobacteraceae bacterium]|nr:hypothetical protein [Syntrophobacteraceae bacterium]